MGRLLGTDFLARSPCVEIRTVQPIASQIYHTDQADFGYVMHVRMCLN